MRRSPRTRTRACTARTPRARSRSATSC
jgi:hypothetical protein